MLDIPWAQLVLPGDTVTTTGFDGVFPADVPVGTVEDVLGNEADEFKLWWSSSARITRDPVTSCGLTTHATPDSTVCPTPQPRRHERLVALFLDGGLGVALASSVVPLRGVLGWVRIARRPCLWIAENAGGLASDPYLMLSAGTGALLDVVCLTGGMHLAASVTLGMAYPTDCGLGVA